jgi:hypothetical protein
MNSLVNFKDTEMNRMAVWISDILIRELPFEEKSNLSSNPIYSETLLEIVESYLHSYINYNDLIEMSLELIHKLNIKSYEVIGTQILDKLMKVTLMAIDLYPNHENLLLKAFQISSVEF